MLSRCLGPTGSPASFASTSRFRVEPSTDLYDEVSERVQDLVQDALLSPQSEYHDLGMTCRIAGPLEVSDELSQGEVGEAFEPLLSVLSDDQADAE